MESNQVLTEYGLDALSAILHEIAREKGFWDGEYNHDKIGNKLALVHSEVTEVLEAIRKSKVSGSAGQLTTELQGRGYIVQPAVNTSETTPKQTATVVYYLPGSESQAALVAAELGGVATAIMPAPIPTEGGKLGEASVLILLGTDVAGKPLASPVPTVPVAPAVVDPNAPTTVPGG